LQLKKGVSRILRGCIETQLGGSVGKRVKWSRPSLSSRGKKTVAPEGKVSDFRRTVKILMGALIPVRGKEEEKYDGLGAETC